MPNQNPEMKNICLKLLNEQCMELVSNNEFYYNLAFDLLGRSSYNKMFNINYSRLFVRFVSMFRENYNHFKTVTHFYSDLFQ